MRRGLATTQFAITSKYETCGSWERRVDTEVTVAPWIPLRALFQHQPPGRLSLFQHQLRHSLRKLFSSDAALNRKNAASTSFPAPFSLFRLITIQCLPSNRLIDGKQPNQSARFCNLGFHLLLVDFKRRWSQRETNFYFFLLGVCVVFLFFLLFF